jgi:hypothetical protein
MTAKRKAVQRLTVHEAIHQRDEARREALREAGRTFTALRERDEARRTIARLVSELSAANGLLDALTARAAACGKEAGK